MNTAMTTDPDQIRARVAELLSELPELSGHSPGDPGADDSTIDDVARRLEHAHDVLVQALESVEKD